MHNEVSVRQHDTHQFRWDFDIQTVYLSLARRPDLIITHKKEKRTCKIVDFTVPTDQRIKLKQSEKKDKYLSLAKELKKLWNMKVTVVPIEDRQNTEKSSGDLRRLTVTQTPIKNHQLTLVRKTQKVYII